MSAAAERLVLTAVLTLLVAVIVGQAIGLSVVARLAPLAVGVPTLMLLGLELARDAGRWRHEHEHRAVVSPPPVEAADEPMSILVWAAGLVLGAFLFGMAVGLPLFLALYLRMRSAEGWTMAAVSAASLFVLLHGGLEVLLRVPLYDGLLGFGGW
jgi:xanthine/uracil permease